MGSGTDNVVDTSPEDRPYRSSSDTGGAQDQPDNHIPRELAILGCQ